MAKGLGYLLIVLAYTCAYVGAKNLKNGGKGPKFLESLGYTGTLTNADTTTAMGSSNQTGNIAVDGGLASPGLNGMIQT